jgi:hypothetical protein
MVYGPEQNIASISMKFRDRRPAKLVYNINKILNLFVLVNNKVEWYGIGLYDHRAEYSFPLDHHFIPSGTVYRGALVRTDVWEIMSLLSSGSHSCVTVESHFRSLFREGHHLWWKSAVFWDAFRAVSIKDTSWVFKWTPFSFENKNLK